MFKTLFFERKINQFQQVINSIFGHSPTTKTGCFVGLKKRMKRGQKSEFILVKLSRTYGINIHPPEAKGGKKEENYSLVDKLNH